MFFIFGPTDLGGWSYKLTYICLSVIPFVPIFVCPSISLSVCEVYLDFSPKQLYGSSQFLYECRGQQDALFEQDGFSKKKHLIQDYRGSSDQKGVFCYFLGLFSKTALRIFLIFCMSVEDNRAHRFSQMVFLKNSKSRIIGD